VNTPEPVTDRPTVGGLGHRRQEYTALARRWDERWEVFVLDSVEGLIGTTTALTSGDVEYAARALVARQLDRRGRAPEVKVTVIHR
jgi:hypothetical protein